MELSIFFLVFLSWLFNVAVSIETNVVSGRVVSECEAVGGVGELKCLEKTCPIATLSTTNST
jgi:hypothetical protein